jgi:hypothetical protein
MVKLNPFLMKFLKFFHVIFSTAFAGAVIYQLIGLMICKYQNENFIIGIMQGVDLYEEYIIIPSMWGLVITGLIYSIFTVWGFKKFYWIIVKWFMTIVFIYMISVLSGNLLQKKLVSIVLGNNFSKNDPVFLTALLNVQILYGTIAFLFLLIVLISIFKPFGKINAGKNNRK